MRTYDLTPLFRSTVGFDRFAELFDALSRAENGNASYPPYNIEKTGDNSYRITMAVSGFGEDDLAVTVRENLLTVAGKLADQDDANYLHRGIATRAFERKFNLEDHVKVTGAELSNGLLRIELERELPEAMKPRRINIRGVSTPRKKAIEGSKAA